MLIIETADLETQGSYEPSSWKYGSIPDWPEPKYELERRGSSPAVCLAQKRCFWFDQFDLDLGISVNQGAIAAGWFLQ